MRVSCHVKHRPFDCSVVIVTLYAEVTHKISYVAVICHLCNNIVYIIMVFHVQFLKSNFIVN